MSNIELRNIECRSGDGGGGCWDFRLSILDFILNLNRFAMVFLDPRRTLGIALRAGQSMMSGDSDGWVN